MEGTSGTGYGLVDKKRAETDSVLLGTRDTETTKSHKNVISLLLQPKPDVIRAI